MDSCRSHYQTTLDSHQISYRNLVDLASFAGQKIISLSCLIVSTLLRLLRYLLIDVATTNTTMAGTGAENIFGYTPSMPMAWIGGIIFSLTALIHIYQYFKHRAWYFYLMMLGILMEVFGFWTRVVVIKNPNNNAAISMTFLLTTFVSKACCII